MPDILRDAVILNVDDDPTGRYAITRTLQQVGCRVLEAITGAKALELISSQPVDLVLLDVNLPDMLGFEVAERLKADPATAAIPILYLSATSIDADSIVRGLEGGAEGYLTEPVSPEVLVSTVRALLRARRAAQEADQRAQELEKALAQLQVTHEELEVTNEELAVANEELQTSHDELAQQQAFTQSIIDGTPGPVFVKDREGRFLVINSQLEKLLGRSREEVKGRTDHDFFPPWIAASYQEHDRRVLETGAPEQVEEEADLTDGHHAFLAYKFPLYNTRGEAYAVAAISTDITERKRMEEALRRQAALLNLSYEAIFSWEFDGAILSWNQGAERLYGYDREEAVGEVSHDLLGTVFPTSRDEVLDELARKRVWTGELVHTTRDGRTITVESRQQLMDRGGGRRIVLETNRDITARKQAEEALRESEQQFRALAESIPNLAWWANGDGYITWYNQRWYEYTGTTPEQMEGWGWQSVHDPEVLPAVLERWQASLTAGEPFEMTFPLRGADGVFRPFLTRIVPVKDAQGRVVRWFGTNTDVTVLEEARRALRAREAQLRTILDSQTEGVVAASPEGDVAEWNPTALTMHGFTTVEEARRPLSEFPKILELTTLDGAAIPLEQWPLSRVLRGEVLHQWEVRIRRLDQGWERVFSYSGAMAYTSDRRPLMAVLAIRDVTDRRQGEEEREALLRQVEDQRTLLETIINSTRSAIAYLGPDLSIRVVNRSFVEHARLSREALIGQNYRELFARPQTEAVFHQVLATKQSVERLEMPYVFPNQQERGVLYLDWRLTPLLDEQGEVEGFISTTLDVTDRVRERQRIEEQERFLAAFLENAPAAMAYLDTDLRYVRVNRAYTEWMALSSEQLVGRTHPEVTGIEERAETMRRVVATGEPERRQEMPVTFARWTERLQRYIDYAVFPVKNEDGQVVGVVLSLDDATDRVLQREQLLAAERARAELAESLNREIAHRTKNNLAMAAGLLQLQVYQQRDPEVGTVLSETMARLMTFASIQEEMQTTTSAGWVDLLPVLRRIGAASAGAFAGGEAVVSVIGESVVLPSKAATNLAIVANELITNAIKHGAPGPGKKLRIDVTMERVDGGRSLQLCVWNTGNPVPEGFDPTQQQGMGLHLVHDLAARQYGGTFTLRPEADGTLAEILVPLEAVRRG